MRIWDWLKIGDAWAFGYRNARALGAALVLVVAILSMLSLRCNPVVESTHILGLVVEIEAEKVRLLDAGEPLTRVLVAVPDSSEVRILLPPPPPRIGDFVPLSAERHKRGNTDYFLETEKWRTEGPQ